MYNLKPNNKISLKTNRHVNLALKSSKAKDTKGGMQNYKKRDLKMISGTEKSSIHDTFEPFLIEVKSRATTLLVLLPFLRNRIISQMGSRKNQSGRSIFHRKRQVLSFNFFASVIFSLCPLPNKDNKVTFPHENNKVKLLLGLRQYQLTGL